ncbi:MAG: FmdB family zinc ribbon protein [Desulfonatronovibrionaceae bacterium]
MPIYEYQCTQCGHEFEELIQPGDNQPQCPCCGAEKTVKKMSTCALKNKGSRESPACAPSSGFS